MTTVPVFAEKSALVGHEVIQMARQISSEHIDEIVESLVGADASNMVRDSFHRELSSLVAATIVQTSEMAAKHVGSFYASDAFRFEMGRDAADSLRAFSHLPTAHGDTTMSESAPLTMEQVEAAIEAILGTKLYAHLASDVHRNIPRDIERAAVSAWTKNRSEDEHSAILRAALINLNTKGVIIPKEAA